MMGYLEGYHLGSHAHNPTDGMLSCLIESVNVGSDKLAAERLGITEQTLKNQLSDLYRRIGASNRPHAVYLLWPVIGDQLMPEWKNRRSTDRKKAA